MRADPTCRRCGVDLDEWNARRYGGRFVGACRGCESIEGMERAARRRATVRPGHRRAGRCQTHDDLAWLYEDQSIECMYVRSVDFADGECEWGAMAESWRHPGQDVSSGPDNGTRKRHAFPVTNGSEGARS